MHKVIVLTLLLSIQLMAIQTAPSNLQVQAISHNSKILQLSVAAPSTVEHFTLGNEIDGAVAIYSYQNTLTYDSVQDEITVNVNYPLENESANDISNAIITKVDLYIEGNVGFVSQAYITAGGIGERSISLEIIANATDSLRYMIIVNGVKTD